VGKQHKLYINIFNIFISCCIKKRHIFTKQGIYSPEKRKYSFKKHIRTHMFILVIVVLVFLFSTQLISPILTNNQTPLEELMSMSINLLRVLVQFI
jgi:hypothetical protein